MGNLKKSRNGNLSGFGISCLGPLLQTTCKLLGLHIFGTMNPMTIIPETRRAE
jgi:hypothetical protein